MLWLWTQILKILKQDSNSRIPSIYPNFKRKSKGDGIATAKLILFKAWRYQHQPQQSHHNFSFFCRGYALASEEGPVHNVQRAAVGIVATVALWSCHACVWEQLLFTVVSKSHKPHHLSPQIHFHIYKELHVPYVRGLTAAPLSLTGQTKNNLTLTGKSGRGKNRTTKTRYKNQTKWGF